MSQYDIAIVGGGPAGLFCAIQAGAAGLSVLLLEKKRSPGQKLLLSGSGRCNLTHAGDIRGFLSHYGRNGKFLKPALFTFSNDDLVSFFRSRGLETIVRENGKIFPASLSSADVLALLVSSCREHGADLRCGEPVRSVSRDTRGFSITTEEGVYRAAALVIATGGMSYPSTGSTGDGYRLADSLGQPVTPVAPALTPVIIRDYPFSDLAGISSEAAPFSLWRGGRKIGDYAGDILLTHTGLSGPGVLDASRDFLPGDDLRISLLGKDTRHRREELDRSLRGAEGTRLVRSVLAGYPVPGRLARRIFELEGIPADLRCARLTASLRNRIVTLFTAYPLSIASLGDFTVAMVTRGGVALEGVNPKTLESRIISGLSFCGEVLDIDGDSGGYNLQAAFSTGFLAARRITEKFRKRQGTLIT